MTDPYRTVHDRFDDALGNLQYAVAIIDRLVLLVDDHDRIVIAIVDRHTRDTIARLRALEHTKQLPRANDLR